MSNQEINWLERYQDGELIARYELPRDMTLSEAVDAVRSKYLEGRYELRIVDRMKFPKAASGQ